jgi:hypothetical protein
MNLHLPVIRTSSAHSLHFSTRLKNLLTLMHGSYNFESKFALLSTPCSEANKALFAAQQLRGTARIWWDHYFAM